MAVSYSTFIIRFPEFTTAVAGEQARITTFITDATLEVNSDSWGAKTDLGISYLAAHRLAMANRTVNGAPAGSGAITEAKAGKLGVKFGALPTTITNIATIGLASTPYGMTYAEMRSTLSITPLTA